MFLGLNTMDDKLKIQHHEKAADPYTGLFPEDAECLQRYDGKEGKKVVRKVLKDISLHHELMMMLIYPTHRSTSD